MEPIPVQQARSRYGELVAAPRDLLDLTDRRDDRTRLAPAAALVFALGAWECCCEELLRAAAVAVVGAARRPDDLPRAVPETLVDVTGEPGEPWDVVARRLGGGWHRAAIRHLGRALEGVFRHWNTPSGHGVDRLAERVAAMTPISPRWPAVDGHPGADVLDAAIRRRGEAVHLARIDIDRGEVRTVLDLLEGIVDVTATTVGRRIAHLPPVSAG